jgi:ribosomal protein L37AE/L43A
MDPDEMSKPDTCPSCGSRAVGTLARTITPDTAWRCQACGVVWKVAATLPRVSPSRDR